MVPAQYSMMHYFSPTIFFPGWSQPLKLVFEKNCVTIRSTTVYPFLCHVVWVMPVTGTVVKMV
jgi:hypothetical protein